MDDNIAVYLGTVALLAFVLKSIILFNVEIRSAVSRCFAVLCFIFVIQNAAEFLGYFTYLGGHKELGEFFVHIYMVALYMIFPTVLHLALLLSQSPRARQVTMVNFSLVMVISLAHAGGYVVSGFEFLNWTLITTPGRLYALAMVYILANLLITFAYLISQALFNERFEIRHRAKVYLAAFLPLLLVVVSVIFLRFTGFDASSAISLPIATTFFLFVLLLHTNGNLFWLSLRLRIILELLRLRDLSSIDEVIERLDEVRIRQALRASNGNQRKAAQLINFTEPTLSRRIARYGIDVSEYQTRASRLRNSSKGVSV